MAFRRCPHCNGQLIAGLGAASPYGGRAWEATCIMCTRDPEREYRDCAHCRGEDAPLVSGESARRALATALAVVEAIR
jgi:hypothetical protein